MRKSALLLPVLAVAIIGILSSLYIVDEREKALVLQFGQIKKVVDEPGLGVKIPIIQEVVRYDRRILSLDTDAIEVTPSDDRRLVVDAFTRYRIADVVQFRQAVGIGGTRVAEDRLASVLNAQIREVLGADQVTSDTILSPQRRDLAVRILEQARASAAGLGLEIVDVRLKQTNLPQQNLDATFARMRAEREREAADEIARGNEAAQRVRAAADRTVVETVSNAEREAEITRGEADAERNRIYAEAFGNNPEFFAFYRSLAALERSMNEQNSTLVFSPQSEFLGQMFDAVRADGLGEVALEEIDIDRLREMAPETEISPDLPESERQRLEEDAAQQEAEAAEEEASEQAAEEAEAEAEAETEAEEAEQDNPVNEDVTN
ncbi:MULTISPECIES: protease modulator HflC [Roseovarius]|uniref:protease modulator HflC n=1 Tax=Roseovarius TaxID=74030 RepID=UPI001C954E9B|nr:protease modulator HflC [Roseovarius atlanticus]MBY5987003.1 protease modulator HflC [Roseovarius atlanticus]MBY6125643.1 protease modulator HflC [Roseovarius atlanticus]MBY6149896.1 protease modulator HflC [Roseovarius atlanticus]